MNVTVTSAVATAIVTALAGWVINRRKDAASATDAITSAAGRLVSDVSADNQRLRDDIKALRDEIAALRVHEIAALRVQMAEDQRSCDKQLSQLRVEIAALKGSHQAP